MSSNTADTSNKKKWSNNADTPRENLVLENVPPFKGDTLRDPNAIANVLHLILQLGQSEQNIKDPEGNTITTVRDEIHALLGTPTDGKSEFSFDRCMGAAFAIQGSDPNTPLLSHASKFARKDDAAAIVVDHLSRCLPIPPFTPEAHHVYAREIFMPHDYYCKVILFGCAFDGELRKLENFVEHFTEAEFGPTEILTLCRIKAAVSKNGSVDKVEKLGLRLWDCFARYNGHIEDKRAQLVVTENEALAAESLGLPIKSLGEIPTVGDVKETFRFARMLPEHVYGFKSWERELKSKVDLDSTVHQIEAGIVNKELWDACFKQGTSLQPDQYHFSLFYQFACDHISRLQAHTLKTRPSLRPTWMPATPKYRPHTTDFSSPAPTPKRRILIAKTPTADAREPVGIAGRAAASHDTGDTLVAGDVVSPRNAARKHKNNGMDFGRSRKLPKIDETFLEEEEDAKPRAVETHAARKHKNNGMDFGRSRKIDEMFLEEEEDAKPRAVETHEVTSQGSSSGPPANICEENESEPPAAAASTSKKRRAKAKRTPKNTNDDGPYDLSGAQAICTAAKTALEATAAETQGSLDVKSDEIKTAGELMKTLDSEVEAAKKDVADAQKQLKRAEEKLSNQKKHVMEKRKSLSKLEGGAKKAKEDAKFASEVLTTVQRLNAKQPDGLKDVKLSALKKCLAIKFLGAEVADGTTLNSMDEIEHWFNDKELRDWANFLLIDLGLANNEEVIQIYKPHKKEKVPGRGAHPGITYNPQSKKRYSSMLGNCLGFTFTTGLDEKKKKN